MLIASCWCNYDHMHLDNATYHTLLLWNKYSRVRLYNIVTSHRVNIESHLNWK